MSNSDYDSCVFITCPFDDDYKNILLPSLFTILYFDFKPRIALESSDSGSLRLAKILQLIEQSRLSIHDISRLQSKDANEYSRLNMPFELGLDYSSKIFAPHLKKKKFLILETEQHDYRKAISDINGLDIKHHEDNPLQVVECIRNWFVETVGLRDLDGSPKIWLKYNNFITFLLEKRFQKYYTDFNKVKSWELAEMDIEKMPIPEFTDEIKGWLKKYK